MDLNAYWEAVLKQNAQAIKKFFHKDAYVNWHNTNEHFTVEEFIRVNCEYPGEWEGKIERVEQLENLFIAAVNVYSSDGSLFFHVVSFIKTEDNKITAVDEYWGDDGQAPKWRADKKIGTEIRQKTQSGVV